MKRIASNIRHFFIQPVPKETLAFFRIAISAFALIQLVVLLPDWMWFYGPAGLIPWEVSEPLAKTHMPSLGNIQSILSWLHVSANSVVYFVTGTYVLSLVGLLIGYKTRLMGFLAWLMHGILNATGHLTAYGVETFTHIALFYCMVLPVGICWSIDSRNKISRIPGYLVTLSVRLIQLHLCIMYLSCGVEKAMGTQWWNGEAIWIALQQDQFHTVNMNWLANFPLVPKLLCWSTIIIEGLYPMGMMLKKTRKFWLISILSMHTFIAVFLGLHLFGALMILLNISAFAPILVQYESSKIRGFADTYLFRFTRLVKIDGIL
ncbi:MAG: HTTM domain-containing protein [Chitinophagaceae bacterium]